MPAAEADNASILHLASDSPLSESFEAALADLGLGAVKVGDPYKALARIVCRPERSFGAVLADLDAFVGSELEFFTHVGRLSPTTATYVYAGRRTELIERAIALGSWGRIAPEMLEDRLGRLLAASAPPTQPVPATEPTSTPTTEAQAEPSVADEPEVTEPEAAPSSPDADDGAVPPRQPPVRIPPDRRRPADSPGQPAAASPGGEAAPGASGTEPPSPRDGGADPLITTEELEALLGDDVAGRDGGTA